MAPSPRAVSDAGPDASDLGVVDGLVQTSFAVQAVLAEIAATHDLSIIQLRLLGILRDRDPRMAQLAQFLSLTKSSATGLIDRAERRGLVRRTTMPVGDERAVHVAITDEGRRLIDTAAVQVARRIRALVEDLSAADQQRLSPLLTRVAVRDADRHGVDLAAERATTIASRFDVSAADGPHDLATSATERIAVIIGSTRPGRICPGIATWVTNAAQEESSLSYELIDLAEIDLPFLDEPRMAALGKYEHDHTRAWSRLVSGYDGFVFVFPQYNWGYPAPLKNALDFLYREWNDKPAASVTYGTRGGNRGDAQIHEVFAGLHMRSLQSHLQLVITEDDVDENWQLKDLDATMSPYLKQARALDREMTAAITGKR